jgi:hypothetical protein
MLALLQAAAVNPFSIASEAELPERCAGDEVDACQDGGYSRGEGRNFPAFLK